MIKLEKYLATRLHTAITLRRIARRHQYTIREAEINQRIDLILDVFEIIEEYESFYDELVWKTKW